MSEGRIEAIAGQHAGLVIPVTRLTVLPDWTDLK